MAWRSTVLQSAVAALIAASAPAVLAGNGTRAATGQRLGATKVGATTPPLGYYMEKNLCCVHLDNVSE